ncbi:MAG: hypothetical protein WAL59_01195, partial [Roseiarcus sp.]
MRRGGGWNTAEGRAGAAKNLEGHHLDFLGLQPIEIPQNGQRFVWKSLDENSLDLEKLAEKLGRLPLFGRLYSRPSRVSNSSSGSGGMAPVANRNPRHGSTPAARPPDDRRGNFPPRKALKTHKTAKESRFLSEPALLASGRVAGRCDVAAPSSSILL